jgi:hypothetical protein
MRLISFAVLSTALICSVPATAKTQSEQEQQTVGNPADKKVCRRLKTSGSRMAERVCLTKEQWKQVDALK